MGDRVNKGFFFTRKRITEAILTGGQKKVAVIMRWLYYLGGRKAGLHCICLSD